VTVNVNAQGVVTLKRSLARGSHSITAVFVPNPSLNGSGPSNAVGLTVS
jgi:hypothetical protein